jgi:hypothetical protein
VLYLQVTAPALSFYKHHFNVIFAYNKIDHLNHFEHAVIPSLCALLCKKISGTFSYCKTKTPHPLNSIVLLLSSCPPAPGSHWSLFLRKCYFNAILKMKNSGLATYFVEHRTKCKCKVLCSKCTKNVKIGGAGLVWQSLH